MTCCKKALMVMIVTTLLGIWGCAQSNTPAAGSVRLRELEAKAARLEDDFKTAAAARDQARKKVSVLEEQRGQLQQQVEQLERVAVERDQLKQSLTQRTAERDIMHNSLTQFGRDLQHLVTKVEQAANQVPASPPVSATASPVVTSPQQ